MIDTEIKEKKDCMGCYACKNICSLNCITMQSDNEGFWYPKVNYENCTKCGKCINVCPIMNQKEFENKPQGFACINRDENIRLESSSGGIFTLIAEQVIEDGGVVFGAAFNEKFQVEHSYIEVQEELYKFRGSKYVQSKIGETYNQAKKFLEMERKVLFTGTPCQIAGLKSFLGRPYENLFCIDIVCHGVPSPYVWEKYIKYREKKAGSTTQRIAFRRKDEGWKRYSVSFLFKNDTEYLQNFKRDPYMRAFLTNICLRPSCYDCHFKSINRQSDVTLADFWGIKNLLPEMDDDKGTSLVFVNTSKGKSMMDHLADKVICKELDINQAVKYNSAAIKSVQCNPNRDLFFRELNRVPFEQLINKHCMDSITTRIRKKVVSLAFKVLKRTGLLKLVKRLLKSILTSINANNS